MEGGGNDFILLNSECYPQVRNQELIQSWCDRHRGIGADGLISIVDSETENTDFHMIYHNADGSTDCFCGNGARCAVAFARKLYSLPNRISFTAYDGLHQAICHSSEDIEISLRPVQSPEKIESGFFVDTGSRHFSCQRDHLDGLNLQAEVSQWRYHKTFQPKGVNVNYWTEEPGGLYMRTFEKGVEAETLACGTGIVAVALTYHTILKKGPGPFEIQVRMKGGLFHVRAEHTTHGYRNIFLRGPVRHVFSGEMLL
jgi:diaminopimelate epimerase